MGTITKKVYCKNNYLQYSHGKLIAFYKNKIYDVIDEYLDTLSIEGERDICSTFSIKTFNFHFINMSEFRENRINEILND